MNELTTGQKHTLALVENMAANGSSSLNERKLLESTIRNGKGRTLKDVAAQVPEMTDLEKECAAQTRCMARMRGKK